jgi:general L-amino acid transport system substrate-binding protein
MGNFSNWRDLVHCLASGLSRTTFLLLFPILLVSPGNAQTLKAVKERGVLNCGVSQGLLGFSDADDKNNWSGFDVDFCRAVAAAIFDDPSKVTFVPLDSPARFSALQSNKIDVLSRNTTWTMSRENSLGVLFAGIAFYDGQGFMLRRDAKIDTALALSGKTVCTQSATTTELNLADYFRANNMSLSVATFPTAQEARTGYDEKKCDVLTSDVSQLYAERLKLSAPNTHIILPEVISKEPLGPVVRQGDDQWFNLIKWTLYALINAEEIGVGQQSIDEAMKSQKPDVRRIVGTEGAFGEQLGLSKDWAARAVKAVGNYGEIYERNVGSQSKLAIPRGLNALWTDGGVQYAPPIR